jgi:hypothetical protein
MSLIVKRAQVLAVNARRRYSFRVGIFRWSVSIAFTVFAISCAQSAPPTNPVAAHVIVSRLVSDNVPPRETDCTIDTLNAMPVQPYKELGTIQIPDAVSDPRYNQAIIAHFACSMGADAVVMHPVREIRGAALEAIAVAYNDKLADRVAQAHAVAPGEGSQPAAAESAPAGSASPAPSNGTVPEPAATTTTSAPTASATPATAPSPTQTVAPTVTTPSPTPSATPATAPSPTHVILTPAATPSETPRAEATPEAAATPSPTMTMTSTPTPIEGASPTPPVVSTPAPTAAPSPLSTGAAAPSDIPLSFFKIVPADESNDSGNEQGSPAPGEGGGNVPSTPSVSAPLPTPLATPSTP